MGTSEHDKKRGVNCHTWTPHLKMWGSIDPLDPVAPRPLHDKTSASEMLRLFNLGEMSFNQHNAVQ